jgi:3',5'-nucleoside bisphosphate phosphatase
VRLRVVVHDRRRRCGRARTLSLSGQRAAFVDSSGVIDLHLHTTASDGLLEPAALVDLAWRAGIRTLSVTDHDTVAAVSEAARHARNAGMTFVPGIEITAVHDGRDVHLLGYFVDTSDEPFNEFLARQRGDRVRRLGEIVDRLEALGMPIDREKVLTGTVAGGSLGRPLIARQLVRAGHAADMRQAFDEWIGQGRPAFVPRVGPDPAEVVGIVARAGGVSSLAHPGLLKRDDLIPGLVDAGLTAIEAFHSDHDVQTSSRYISLAEHYGLAVTGGSDYHGEPVRRKSAFGNVGLPAEHFERLNERVRTKR